MNPSGRSPDAPLTLDDRDRIAATRRRSRQSQRKRGLMRWFRGLLLPGAVRAPGVRYGPRRGVSLARALSPKGPGTLIYDARFDTGETMTLRASRQRIYHDLSPDPRAMLYTLAPPSPGRRVIDIGCGTGAGAALLADGVGPTGSVVALDRDAESVRFAAMRYPVAWLSYSIGGLGELGDELDSSYDMVLADIAELGDDPATALKELCRVTRVGGQVRVHAASYLSPFQTASERAEGMARLRALHLAVPSTGRDGSESSGDPASGTPDAQPAMLVFHIA